MRFIEVYGISTTPKIIPLSDVEVIDPDRHKSRILIKTQDEEYWFSSHRAFHVVEHFMLYKHLCAQLNDLQVGLIKITDALKTEITTQIDVSLFSLIYMYQDEYSDSDGEKFPGAHIAHFYSDVYDNERWIQTWIEEKIHRGLIDEVEGKVKFVPVLGPPLDDSYLLPGGESDPLDYTTFYILTEKGLDILEKK